MTPRATQITAFLVGMIGIALFAIMDAVMKGLVLALGTYTTLLWRSFVGVGLAGALFAANRPQWPERATLNIHLTRGAVSTVMGVLFFWGLARVPLAQAIALAFIAPLIALVLAATMLGEKVEKRTVGASLIAFAGVAVILIGQAQADLGREAMLGSLAIVLSALLYALNLILMRRQSQASGPAEAAFFQNVTVSALLLAALPSLGTSMPAAEHWPWILLAALLSTASLLLLSWAYARAEASYLAATEYSSFLWAMLLGWLVFGETVSPYTLAGAALIVAGCFLAARRAEEVRPGLEVAA
jgi:S-adenosylmethionine uptake transporter